MYVQYILYNSRRCARKKCAQRWCIHQFPCCYNHETFQGVPLDSLGVGAVKIRRTIAPDRRQCRQEAPKRIQATPVAFLRFPASFLRRRGVWGGIHLFPASRCGLGALKDKKHVGGQKPPACFGTCCVPSILKPTMESNETPWGSSPSKSGAIMRPIIAGIARKRRCAYLATPVAFRRFFVRLLWRGGVRGRLCLFQMLRCGWGALKDKKHAGGF